MLKGHFLAVFVTVGILGTRWACPLAIHVGYGQYFR